eukprot:10810752-Ditylum_brightwellii.AAC.1
MTCANFKPLEATMEELVKYLKGVKRSETENPPKRNPKPAAAQRTNKNLSLIHISEPTRP